MKRTLVSSLTLFILLAGIFISCEKEKSCKGCINGNKPPIAIAGPDQVITLPADSILLDGSASNDQNGTINKWLWTKISGPSSLNIANTSTAKTAVTNLVVGIYQFELKVTDNGDLSAKDTMLVAVNNLSPSNRPPDANAGPDQTITLPSSGLTIDGSGSTDQDNNIISYLWTKVSGPLSFNIANPSLKQTQVTNLVEGVYQFELKVRDAGGLFAKDTMQVNVNSTPPNRPIVNALLIPVGVLSQPRDAMAVASAGTKVLFAGGGVIMAPGQFGHATSRVDIYDYSTNSWSTAELCAPRISIAATVNDNKIFFAGGDTINWDADDGWPVDSVDIYDATTNTWTVSHLSCAGYNIAAVAVGNKVLFAGGNPGYLSESGIYRGKQVDIFDVLNNTRSNATLTESKDRIAATTLNNKIFFAGGSGSKKIEIFDNATGSWSLDTMHEGKSFHGSIALDNKIFWAGGSDLLGNESRLVEIRNVITGSSSIQYLFDPARWENCLGQNILLKDNKIIFLRASGNSRDKFDIYNIATNTWSIGLLPQAIPNFSSFISVNNTIYVAGGYENGILTNQVWKLEF
ncbi:MAG TPA: hypothetical protein VFU29_01825 [Chitinophagaceae bacterium]|nr:hypothetical protein [Chitinophagaceae bacterium]